MGFSATNKLSNLGPAADVCSSIGSGGRVMSGRGCPVLIEMDLQRLPAGISVPSKAEPVEVSLALRDRGWTPYRIWFDAGQRAWIAAVIYRPDAA